MTPEERMTLWRELPEPKVSWETAKRMIDRGANTPEKLKSMSDKALEKMKKN
jgi:hypothetical protein